MEITFWGTRGSIPTFNSDTLIYGGNTACVSITVDAHLLILDAGSGIRVLGEELIPGAFRRIDILLTHLHMDHIQGLGFFKPLFDPNCEIHFWGPSGANYNLMESLSKYLSPPLFPVRLRDLPSQCYFHDVPFASTHIGPFEVLADYICHPGPTVGYRISHQDGSIAYMPDHEPALGAAHFPRYPEWTSGVHLAREVDLLIHDAQYSKEEYQTRIGWGHSSIKHALAFARLAVPGKLYLFHHDPSHTDLELEELYAEYVKGKTFPFSIHIAKEGMKISL